jgi:eukaryotic-like serine/threonine-protein kinase
LQDRYRVERELGEGGAATVYLARDLRHDRPIAIKVFRPELAETLGVDRFTREIRTAANLQHPHILSVHDSGAADGLLYYVMPFVEGESVRARLQREGALPIADAVRILREVADALAFAHSQGVVHRDIKPDNVLMSGKHALVADFGVAKALSEASGRNEVTTLGVALGTPAYMAPEQAAADPHLDHRVDIYALGVLGYELLVGEPPFVRRSPQQVIAAHLSEAAPAVSQRRQSTPPALDALIARCLAKQPSDRYQSADDVVAELERLATPTGMAPTTSLTTPAATPPPVRSNRAVIVGTIAAAVVAVAAWAFLRPKTASALDPNAVVVLPFEFSASPELSYLREGVVNLLEASLTGEGGPRAVASQTTIAHWKRAGGADHGLTEDEARTIARELGAGQLLRGSIVGTPSNVILNATIVSTQGSRPDVQATVNGPADSIAALGARLAAQLLSLRVGEGAERLASLGSVPPAALRAYLEGQELLRTGRHRDALLAFERALAADSTFALAALSHAIAASWNFATAAPSQGAAIAFRHRDKLGPRDLVLLEMWSPQLFAGRPVSGRERIETRERLAARIPDRPEAWYLIGDAYFHSGAASGYDFREALLRADNAFRRALALDPDITYLRRHIVDIAWTDDDAFARVPKLIDSLNLESPDYQLAAAIMRGDSAQVKRLLSNLPNLDFNGVMISGFVATSLGLPDVGDSAFALASARPTNVVDRRGIYRARRTLLLGQGRPAAASRMTAALEQLNDEPGAAPFALDAVLAAVFANGDTVAAARASQQFQGRMHAGVPGVTDENRRNAAWTAGLWASYHADTSTMAQTIAVLDTFAAARNTPATAALSALRADVLRLVSPNATTDRRMLERVDSALATGPALVADVRAAMNLIVARTFEKLGDTRRALRAASRVPPGEVLYVMGAPAAIDQARLNLAVGDTALAITIYRWYLLGRRAAEPEQKRADEAIQKKLDELVRLRR